jgi:predicted ribosome quality control (RQC) complex YloA/Tae2 family protein
MPLVLGSFTVTFLARELAALLGGAEIKSVYISDDRVLSISLRAAGSRLRVLRFLHAPGFALLCVEDQAEKESEFTHLPRFEGPLRGALVSAVEQVDLDRVVRVGLRPPEGTELSLYFELNPSLPNLFLVGGDDTILAMLLKAGTRTRSRRVDTGRKYMTQPIACKTHPSEVTEKHLNALDWWEDDRALSMSVTGVGPFFSKEVAFRAREHGSLFRAYDELMAAYREGKAQPHTFMVLPSASGKRAATGFAWYAPERADVIEIKSAPSLNDAALAILKSLTASRAFEKRMERVAATLKRGMHKWSSVLAEAEQALWGNDQAIDFRKYGELIMANLDKIKKGDTEVVLPDLHSGGKRKAIVTLHPHLTPIANAEDYFRKSRRASRRAAHAQDKLDLAAAKLKPIMEVLLELEHLKDARRLTEIEEKVLFATPPGEKAKPPVDERAERLGIRPRRFTVADGWTVLVGRSARENDALTHRYAAPSDLWFHARQAQGAHVVLRRGKGKAQPSKQVIQEAAAIAAHYSKARTSKHVPVSYTEKRYVKKVRKGPPGMAAMLREKVIFVDPRLPDT